MDRHSKAPWFYFARDGEVISVRTGKDVGGLIKANELLAAFRAAEKNHAHCRRKDAERVARDGANELDAAIKQATAQRQQGRAA